MADFVSNAPVSWPIKIPQVIPEIDFNGLQFSYQWGPMYNPAETHVTTMRLPVQDR